MKNQTEIPKVPRESFKKRLVTETQKRLADWETLLHNIKADEFYVEKDLDGYNTSDHGYYDDNPETYGSATFIAVFYALNWHEYAMCFLYIIFNNDGTFSTDLCENLEEYHGVEDSLSKALVKHDMGTGGWKEGYETILEIIEEAYGNRKIPKPPKH